MFNIFGPKNIRIFSRNLKFYLINFKDFKF